MTDDQLRSLIRDAVARHLAGNGQPGVPAPGGALDGGSRTFAPMATVPPAQAARDAFQAPASYDSGSTTTAFAPGTVTIASAPGGVAIAAAPGSVVHLHISHATFALPAALDGAFDGPCRTEPHAGCTNCGFCQSLGY
jgi:hypothetical protein